MASSTFIASLFSRVPHLLPRQGRLTRRPAARTRLRVEPLEDRSLLSCTFSLMPLNSGAQTLLVLGNAAADKVAIIDHGISKEGLGDQIEAPCPSDPRKLGDGSVHDFENIARLVVRSGGGNDSVSLGGMST